VLPMLLVLLLGIADFGRVFSAGITLEAATRNGAEVAAQEYLQIYRQNGTLTAADYQRLHQVALADVCNETAVLPNYAGGGGTCTAPAAAVCVHDPVTSPPVAYGPDPYCGSEAAAAPGECTSLASSWASANQQAGADSLGYVEVRTCYRFTTLFNLQNLELPFGWGLSLGDIYLQKSRTFTIACYYGSACR